MHLLIDDTLHEWVPWSVTLLHRFRMQKTDLVLGQWCQSSDGVKQGKFFREELPKALLLIWGKRKWRTVTDL
jgi:hypothetical protein